MATARETHSGRLLLRMPRTLHAELAQAAEREGTSLNQLIVGMLSRSVGVPVDDSVSEDVAPAADSEPATEVAASSSRQSRALTYALAVNLVVLLLAGAIAVALLIVAWHGGF